MQFSQIIVAILIISKTHGSTLSSLGHNACVVFGTAIGPQPESNFCLDLSTGEHIPFETTPATGIEGRNSFVTYNLEGLKSILFYGPHKDFHFSYATNKWDMNQSLVAELPSKEDVYYGSGIAVPSEDGSKITLLHCGGFVFYPSPKHAIDKCWVARIDLKNLTTQAEWVETTSLPSARYMSSFTHYSTSSSQHVCIFGGFSFQEGVHLDLDCLDLSTFQWTVLQPPPLMVPHQVGRGSFVIHSYKENETGHISFIVSSSHNYVEKGLPQTREMAIGTLVDGSINWTRLDVNAEDNEKAFEVTALIEYADYGHALILGFGCGSDAAAYERSTLVSIYLIKYNKWVHYEDSRRSHCSSKQTAVVGCHGKIEPSYELKELFNSGIHGTLECKSEKIAPVQGVLQLEHHDIVLRQFVSTPKDLYAIGDSLDKKSALVTRIPIGITNSSGIKSKVFQSRKETETMNINGVVFFPALKQILMVGASKEVGKPNQGSIYGVPTNECGDPTDDPVVHIEVYSWLDKNAAEDVQTSIFSALTVINEDLLAMTGAQYYRGHWRCRLSILNKLQKPISHKLYADSDPEGCGLVMVLSDGVVIVLRTSNSHYQPYNHRISFSALDLDTLIMGDSFIIQGERESERGDFRPNRQSFAAISGGKFITGVNSIFSPTKYLNRSETFSLLVFNSSVMLLQSITWKLPSNKIQSLRLVAMKPVDQLAKSTVVLLFRVQFGERQSFALATWDASNEIRTLEIYIYPQDDDTHMEPQDMEMMDSPNGPCISILAGRRNSSTIVTLLVSAVLENKLYDWTETVLNAEEKASLDTLVKSKDNHAEIQSMREHFLLSEKTMDVSVNLGSLPTTTITATTISSATDTTTGTTITATSTSSSISTVENIPRRTEHPSTTPGSVSGSKEDSSDGYKNWAIIAITFIVLFVLAVVIFAVWVKLRHAKDNEQVAIVNNAVHHNRVYEQQEDEVENVIGSNTYDTIP